LNARLDSRYLGHAGAGYNAGGADRSGPDADFDSVHSGVDQFLRPLTRADISGHQLRVGMSLLDFTNGVDHAGRVTMRRVDHQAIDAGLDQFIGALAEITCGPERRGNS